MIDSDKIKISIARLKTFTPKESKYWLAFSGGKDSIVIYRLAEMSGVPFQPYYSITTVDPPELIAFIRQNYPTVLRILPEKTMWQLIRKKGFPPTPMVRYCCEWLKERAKDGLIIDGIRASESRQRSKRGVLDACFKNKRTFYLHPIIDWTDDDVWSFIRSENLKYPTLYDKGRKRIGCILCPYAPQSQRRQDILDYPKFYKAYIRAFDRMLKERSQLKKPLRGPVWQTGEEVMNWWIKF